ncbi:uncharacterized protein [Pseudorasbora parva]|uniref:uncharacterized protein isoform X1 n=1 Tax=Pseudorasbora parva TaxID=51549 RepID=UPI00351DC963
MNICTMPTIFESAEHSSEHSHELMVALAAGRWWAITEVSDPISEEPEEYRDLISGQCWGTGEAGRSSCPTSLVFSDASEKASSQNSGFSDTTLKTTKHWRENPFLQVHTGSICTSQFGEGGLTSSLAFTYASEKAQLSGFSDPTLKTTDQRRKWILKKPQGAPGAPVPLGSCQEPHVPIGSQPRREPSIPEYLIKHLQEPSIKTVMPANSLEKAPVAASKVLTCSPHGVLIPNHIAVQN